MVKRVKGGAKNPAAASGASGVPGTDIDRYGTGVAGFPAPQPHTQVIPTVDNDSSTSQSGWRIVLMLGWVGGILGYSTVWAVSRQIGLPTWWLGPRSAPSPFYLVSLPFVLPVLMLIMIAFNLRRIALYGVIAAVATVGFAALDAATQPGLAIVQLAVSVGLLSASLAALIGGLSSPRSSK